MIIIAIMGPTILMVIPITTCIGHATTPNFINTALVGAANKVCIKKIGIVYFEKN